MEGRGRVQDGYRVRVELELGDREPDEEIIIVGAVTEI